MQKSESLWFEDLSIKTKQEKMEISSNSPALCLQRHIAQRQLLLEAETLAKIWMRVRQKICYSLPTRYSSIDSSVVTFMEFQNTAGEIKRLLLTYLVTCAPSFATLYVIRFRPQLNWFSYLFNFHFAEFFVVPVGWFFQKNCCEITVVTTQKLSFPL